MRIHEFTGKISDGISFYCKQTALIRKLAERSSPSPPWKALWWIKNNELPTGGIRVHSKHSNGYPEVTGYIVPTLADYGERDLAKRLTRWLLCIQRANGSFTSTNGAPYVFDTGQALRALLTMAEIMPQSLGAAERAANFLFTNLIDNGKKGFGNRYSGDIPESVHLYVLYPFLETARLFNRTEWIDAVENCIDFYCRCPDALRMSTLTHFLAYELEALIDVDRRELAKPVLEALKEEQAHDGAVRAKEGTAWVCTPGLAQLALCWYKIGDWEAADNAMSWLEKHQQASGGFRGSHGKNADYFPNAELSWSAKYYLDAHYRRLVSYIDRNVDIFPTEIPVNDGRSQAILKITDPKDKVLEVGCGKGRFLKMLLGKHPDIKCTGVDISPKMLSQLPSYIDGLEGSLESIPCPDNSFDVVFSVEAIEHSFNPGAAIREMIRVARPGGWIMVIDKQKSHWGRKLCPTWERWPDFSGLKKELHVGCDNVSAEQVAYGDNLASDGLMVVWQGRKRANLSDGRWNDVLISSSSQESLVNRVRQNQVSEWGQAVLLETAPDETVLEIGCGTGEISLHLAQAGRKVIGLDMEKASLSFIKKCAADLEVLINFVAADATMTLPFGDKEIDCTWSSGLLEHFDKDQRRAMLREQARITKKRLIAIVPNASCVGYQAGKKIKEKQGTWKYGLEMPILSLVSDFEAAGLHSISEFSVGAQQGLNFLPRKSTLRKSLTNWMKSLSSNEIRECNQGYLLVTTGIK